MISIEPSSSEEFTCVLSCGHVCVCRVHVHSFIVNEWDYRAGCSNTLL